MVITTRIIYVLFLVILTSACVPLLDATNKGPIEPNPGRRSFGEYLDDKEINTIVTVNIRKAHPDMERSHINVYTFNGVVLLTGEAPSNKLRELAGETARALHKVRQVHNEIQVQSNSTFFSRTNDNWIATKIRTKLIADERLESDRIKLIVENRIVYLMGLLTQEETQLLTELAANTSGVEKVVRAIEYIGT